MERIAAAIAILGLVAITAYLILSMEKKASSATKPETPNLEGETP